MYDTCKSFHFFGSSDYVTSDISSCLLDLLIDYMVCGILFQVVTPLFILYCRHAPLGGPSFAYFPQFLLLLFSFSSSFSLSLRYHSALGFAPFFSDRPFTTHDEKRKVFPSLSLMFNVADIRWSRFFLRNLLCCMVQLLCKETFSFQYFTFSESY